MAVRQIGQRYAVEFQSRGRRVYRRLPPGTGKEEARALENKLRRAIFKFKDLGLAEDEPIREMAHEQVRHDWIALAEILLSAHPIGPRPGVYFLLSQGRLLYVGQSRNVATRLAGHKDKPYDHAVMIDVPRENLLLTEAYMIRMLRPPMNTMLAHVSDD